MSPAFAISDVEESKKHIGHNSGLGGGERHQITNPFLLETEACQKCFMQRSPPFQQGRLNDIKAEARYTDACLIYRLPQAMQFK